MMAPVVPRPKRCTGAMSLFCVFFLKILTIVFYKFMLPFINFTQMYLLWSFFHFEQYVPLKRDLQELLIFRPVCQQQEST
jgi:hypothetical protein